MQISHEVLMRRLLSFKQLRQDYGHPYSRTQTWRKARDPNDPFPAPVSVGPNRTAWFSDEYEAWVESLPRVNYAEPPEPDLDAANEKDATSTASRTRPRAR